MPLEVLQSRLEQLYDVAVPYRVSDFLVTDPVLARALSTDARDTPEALLLQQSEETLDLSLFVDQAVLDRLKDHDPGSPWPAGALQDWWVAMEGVSHFLAVVWRAMRRRSTTALELELQAEIDKFVLTAWSLGENHGTASLPSLHDALFRRSRPREELDPPLQRRYRHASELASAYCDRLPQHHSVWPPGRELLRELRRFYRYDWHTKERYIRRLAAREHG
jgi:hypothetical protein